MMFNSLAGIFISIIMGFTSFVTLDSQIIEIEANKEVVSEEQLEEMKSIVRTRLDNLGYLEAIVETDGNSVVVKMPPEVVLTEEEKASLTKVPTLEFLDADGNVLFDGSDLYVKKAEATFGYTDGVNNPEHYIELSLTKEGQAAFKQATENAVAKIAEGKNYIAISFDGVVYSSPNVYEVIDADSCIITGDFDKEIAEDLANIINSGDIDFEIKIVE